MLVDTPGRYFMPENAAAVGALIRFMSADDYGSRITYFALYRPLACSDILARRLWVHCVTSER